MDVCKHACLQILLNSVPWDESLLYGDLGCRVTVWDQANPVYSRGLEDWASRYPYIAKATFAWVMPVPGCWAAGQV